MKKNITPAAEPGENIELDETQQVLAKREHRCDKCKKLLAIEHLHLPLLEIKCVRCGYINDVLKDYNRQIIITDKNGTILYVNEEVEKATGYASKELLGKTPAIWGNQMPRDFYKKMWHKILISKTAIVVKVKNKHKDGSYYEAIMRISPILDVHGEVEFFIGMETIVDTQSIETEVN